MKRSRDDGSSTRPKPSTLRALQNQPWTVHGAVAELVDNSFGQGRGAATQVTILWNAKTRLLEVLDNGIGMTLIRDLFRLGETVGRRPADIGEYGSGGTMALLYLASEVQIWTLRDGECASGSVRWQDWFTADDFPVVPTVWKRATGRNTPDSLWRKGHGTLIQLKVLPRRKVIDSQIRRDLSGLYAPAVRRGYTLRWINAGHDAIDLVDPIVKLQQSVEFDLVLEVPAADDAVRHFRVTGAIGTIDDLPIERSRVAVSFHHRVIQWTRECYSHSSGRKYPGVGVCGWIHLDDSWQGLLSTTKDCIDDSTVWDVLMDAVFERIEPLLRKLEHEKKTLLLEQIALELSELFDGQRKPDPASYGDLSNEGPIEGPGKGQSGTGPGGRTADGGSRARHEPGEIAGGTAALVSKLEVLFMTDGEMDQQLSRAEVEFRRDGTTGVRAFVNRDHNIIKVAMEQHPVNRMAFAILVGYAVAGQIVIHPGILEAWFGRKLAQWIEGMKPEHRSPSVLRLIMDRFKDMPRAS